MDKLDYKKVFKDLYLPKQKPVIVDIPSMNFVMIEGSGDPNGTLFAQATAALYSLSYAVKMSYKNHTVPDGYYDYVVFPLEGVWDLLDRALPPTVKSNYKYTLMIRQPDFLTESLFKHFLSEVKKKKPNPLLDKLSFSSFEEGRCCQMLHVGSYDDEPASFAHMEAFCTEQEYKRLSRKHREIYLSDPRRVVPEKRRTVLRFQVK
ncbi:GyrI-like domain-containing protein [Sporolactobacillus sp. CPB3-1]|uniref:GyrI-like domain-containing protein n=1 Tax=Sporolactobacillus mangiferae TaxID=2940498 RepID=A0ABT0M9S3_9BACL|nr:GyrI-like domain-containing protein [Sporolactobacillus mangiferae]MCL1631619.1 GyrI-like domain-containing protein [Sporolactobacillus mangiferae]